MASTVHGRGTPGRRRRGQHSGLDAFQASGAGECVQAMHDAFGGDDGEFWGVRGGSRSPPRPELCDEYGKAGDGVPAWKYFDACKNALCAKKDGCEMRALDLPKYVALHAAMEQSGTLDDDSYNWGADIEVGIARVS